MALPTTTHEDEAPSAVISEPGTFAEAVTGQRPAEPVEPIASGYLPEDEGGTPD